MLQQFKESRQQYSILIESSYWNSEKGIYRTVVAAARVRDLAGTGGGGIVGTGGTAISGNRRWRGAAILFFAQALLSVAKG